MGSELLRIPPLEVIREGFLTEGEEELFRKAGLGVSGASVSRFESDSLPTSVESVSDIDDEDDAPHTAQNRPPGDIFAPQDIQNIRPRILSPLATFLRPGRCARCKITAKLRNAFDLHCGPVSQHFGNALHHFCGVITHADHSVCAMFAGVLQHQFECVFAGLFAKIG